MVENGSIGDQITPKRRKTLQELRDAQNHIVNYREKILKKEDYNEKIAKTYFEEGFEESKSTTLEKVQQGDVVFAEIDGVTYTMNEWKKYMKQREEHETPIDIEHLGKLHIDGLVTSYTGDTTHIKEGIYNDYIKLVHAQYKNGLIAEGIFELNNMFSFKGRVISFVIRDNEDIPGVTHRATKNLEVVINGELTTGIDGLHHYLE